MKPSQTKSLSGPKSPPPKSVKIYFGADKRQIIDVTGAGDIVVSTIAMSLIMENDLRKSVYYANKAAGLSVEQLGCGRVKYGEIVEFDTLL